jgi:hypothetical protein
MASVDYDVLIVDRGSAAGDTGHSPVPSTASWPGPRQGPQRTFGLRAEDPGLKCASQFASGPDFEFRVHVT